MLNTRWQISARLNDFRNGHEREPIKDVHKVKTLRNITYHTKNTIK
jgi:hypothetical protein